jgi:hypothetical protein
MRQARDKTAGSFSARDEYDCTLQAFGLISSSGGVDHGYLLKAWAAIGGIYLFFFADKLLKCILEMKKVRIAIPGSSLWRVNWIVEEEERGGIGRCGSVHAVVRRRVRRVREKPRRASADRQESPPPASFPYKWRHPTKRRSSERERDRRQSQSPSAFSPLIA